MLKTYNLTTKEHYGLFMEMSHPEVSPYVRNYVADFNEYLMNISHILDAEERGDMIVRVIFNEWNQPIGMITLYDITEYGGFLSTWLGKQHHGKGYNQVAKELFLNEIFSESEVQTIYLKIRTDNYRSQKAALKLAYITQVDSTYEVMFKMINQTELKYNLYSVTKLSYLANQRSQEMDYVAGNEETNVFI